MPTLKTVAVIGAGAWGRALALQVAEAGYATVLEDVLPSNLRVARAEAGAAPDAAALSQRLSFASCVDDAARGADLILDSVPDELESKLEIFSMLDRMAPPRSILLTPTRVLSIADLASCTYRPERCLAFSFEGEERQIPEPGSVVRLLHTSSTTPEVLAAVEQFWEVLGFAPVSMLDPAESIAAGSRS